MKYVLVHDCGYVVQEGDMLECVDDIATSMVNGKQYTFQRLDLWYVVVRGFPMDQNGFRPERFNCTLMEIDDE